MSMPSYGYVSPEQMMADRANYARKGIARGRSLVALSSQDGIVICAENTQELCAKSAKSTTVSLSQEPANI